ncbi:MAG: hypothetical protein M1813_002139 [Trichoglossum hirsutum]|nr:MAG: hypothetical protein M1813_002139 [Trichoglossum hirsutum]
MNALPHEVFLLIFSYLPSRTDLLNLRLACKSLSRLLAPRVFSSLTFWLESSSLDDLLSISQQPAIAYYVKHLTCSFHRFFEEKTPSETAYLHELCWNVFTDNRHYGMQTYQSVSELAKVKGLDYSVERLEEGYRNYCWYLARQNAALKSGEYVHVLAQALATIPNLQSVTLYGDASLSVHGLRATKAKTLMISHPTPVTRSRDIFTTVIHALSQLERRPLSEFRVVGEAVPMHSFVVPDEERGVVKKALKGLKVLWVNPRGWEGDPDVLDRPRLALLCSSAPELEELVLDVGGRNKLIMRRELDNLIGPNKFPNLRHLEICNVELTPTDLLAFLYRHATSLRTLRLKNIRLHDEPPNVITLSDGSVANLESSNISREYGRKLWTLLLEKLRAGMGLVDVEFEGFGWNDGMGREAGEFVVRRRRDNPLVGLGGCEGEVPLGKGFEGPERRGGCREM